MVELEPENLEAWEFFVRFQSVIRGDGFGGAWVDYQSAKYLAEQCGIEDAFALIEKLDAIAKGFKGSRKKDRNA